jgi:hypothetical protein
LRGKFMLEEMTGWSQEQAMAMASSPGRKEGGEW